MDCGIYTGVGRCTGVCNDVGGVGVGIGGGVGADVGAKAGNDPVADKCIIGENHRRCRACHRHKSSAACVVAGLLLMGELEAYPGLVAGGLAE